MSKFQIESKAGLIFGVYEGATAEDAFAAMIDDAGSSGTEGTAADWIIFEVEPLTPAERGALRQYREDAGCVGDRECIDLIDRALEGDFSAFVEARKMLSEDPQAEQ